MTAYALLNFSRARMIGLRMSNDELQCAYELMCALADKKKKIDDDDLRGIVQSARLKVTPATAGLA